MLVELVLWNELGEAELTVVVVPGVAVPPVGLERGRSRRSPPSKRHGSGVNSGTGDIAQLDLPLPRYLVALQGDDPLAAPKRGVVTQRGDPAAS